MQPHLAIETSALTKSFGASRAVDGIDLAVRAGSIYGFLGPNGAGKTTTLRMLATLIRPDAGRAWVLGHDVVTQAATVRRLVSLTGQFASVDEDLTGFENLVLLARLLGHSVQTARRRADDLLAAFGLEGDRGRTVRGYSGGMRRRLDLAASIVVRPEVVFLDEPTTGLDPRSRSEVWDIIRALVADGSTVLLTTQYLDEADQLADRIAVIDHGRLIAEGTPGELKAATGSGVLHVRLLELAESSIAASVLTDALGVLVEASADPALLTARVNGPERLASALGALQRAGVTVTEFALGQPTLDEVFLSLTGHPAEPEPSGTETEEEAA